MSSFTSRLGAALFALAVFASAGDAQVPSPSISISGGGGSGGGTGSVTSVTCGAGLSGGTITTTGTCLIPGGGITNAMLSAITALPSGVAATNMALTSPTATSVNSCVIGGRHTTGDTTVAIAATTGYEATSATITTSRAWTLPAANAIGAGCSLTVADDFGGIPASGASPIVVTAAGADKIAGNATFNINVTYGMCRFTSDGSANWTPSGCMTVAGIPVSTGWIATVNPNKAVLFTSKGTTKVIAIVGRVSDAAGGAATVAVYKAPSGTACSAGTIQHSGTLDANGTANTDQTLTLVGGAGNALADGDSLCLVTTGTTSWTGGTGIGGVTAFVAPQ